MHCIPDRSLTRLLLRCSAPLALIALSACSSGDDSEAFAVRTGRYTGSNTPLLLQRDTWGVYLASESQSNLGSLNDAPTLPFPDNDTTDTIAIAVRLTTGREYVTGISPLAAEALGTSVYFAVDESQDADWNQNSVVEDVLLQFQPTLDAPVVVDVARFGSGPAVLRSGNRIWYVADETPSGTDATNLRYVEAGAPSTPVDVPSKAATTGNVEVVLVGESNGLLFVGIDEAASGDQNGDADTNDLVLAIVEANAVAPTLVTTQLAISDPLSPVLARPLTGNSWRALFLVDEADQGDGSLNDRNSFGVGWNPPACVGAADTDTLDRVLHFLDWTAGDIVTGSLANTGLSSMNTTGSERLVATNLVVGVLSAESGFGGGSGCDYNNDASFDDVALRFVPVDDIDAAGVPSTALRAVETSLPGGAMGVVEISQRFVIVSQATFTINSIPVTRPFVFWLDPLTDTAFSSDLYDPDTGSSGSPVKVATDHLGDDVRDNRAPVGLLEVSVQQNLNRGCFAVDKDGIVGDGNGDIDDTLASWLVYNTSNNRMLVAGLGWAVQSDNSGLVVAAGRAFFRVSEAEDGFDWNNDGTADDMVLFRSPLTACEPVNMGTLNDIATPFSDAILTRGTGGALYVVEESNANFDVNDNGIVGGFAVRWFRF
jgi:hypothetical protein